MPIALDLIFTLKPKTARSFLGFAAIKCFERVEALGGA